MGFHKIGLKPNSLPELFLGFSIISCGLECFPQVKARLRIAGIDSERLLKACNRVIESVQRMASNAEIAVVLRDVSIDADGPANAFDCFFVLVSLVEYDSQKMQRIGMLRVNAKNLPVDLLRPFQFSRLV
jgi:hypothetical protein